MALPDSNILRYIIIRKICKAMPMLILRARHRVGQHGIPILMSLPSRRKSSMFRIVFGLFSAFFSVEQIKEKSVCVCVCGWILVCGENIIRLI